MPVTMMEINSRRPFADGKSFGDVGAYEQLDGTVQFAVDPDNPANETIADLELAPRNTKGLVTFSSDFRILRPVDPKRGNRRILLDIPNRGKPLALRNINSAPEAAPDAPMDPGKSWSRSSSTRLLRSSFSPAGIIAPTPQRTWRTRPP